MIFHLLFNLLGLLILLLTLPLIVELTILTFAALLFALRFDILKSKHPLTASLTAPHSLIIVVPAHNEGLLIQRTIQSLQSSAALATAANPSATIRICVIAHNCTDDTAQNAAAAGAEVLILNDPALTGKGHALLHGFNTLAPSPNTASNNAFVIIDADTIVAPDLLLHIHTAISTGAPAVQCRYEALNKNLAAVAMRGFNVIRPRGRAQLGLSCGIFGNGFALRADLLNRIPYNAHSIVEDLEYHIALVRNGVRVLYLDQARLQGEIIGSRSQKSRWEGGRARMARQWLPSLLRDTLHLRLRLLGPALDLASLPLAQGVLLLLVALALPVLWLRDFAAAALLIVLLHLIAIILAGNKPQSDLLLLLQAPRYIIQKIFSLPAILRMARNNAAWVRTQRDHEGPQ